MAQSDNRVELYIDGAWVDIVSARDVRQAAPAPDGGISIERGRSDERQHVSPGTATLVINDTAGLYNNRQPGSAYYGKVGRNTPIRIRREGVFSSPAIRGTVTTATGAAGNVSVAIPTGTVAGDVLLCFHTADSSTSAQVVGPSNNTGTWDTIAEVVTGTSSLVTKVYWRIAGGSEVSPIILDQSGSADGVAAVIALSGASHARPKVATSTETPPGASVDSPTITPEGENDFEIRWVAMSDASGAANTWTAPGGTTERADVQSSTFTTAEMVTRTLSSDAATGTKAHTPSSSAHDWAHGLTVTVMADNVRFSGELAEAPPRWNISGRDVYVPIEAAGPLRRLTQGARTLRSVMFRALTAGDDADDIVGYWPCEDETSAKSVASGLADGPPMRPSGSGSVTYRSQQIAPGSDQTLQLNSGDQLVADIPDYDDNGIIMAAALFRIPTPGGVASESLLDVGQGASSIISWSLQAEASGDLSLRGYSGSALVHDSGALAFSIDTEEDVLIGFAIKQNGADADYTVFVKDIDPDSDTVTTTTRTGSFTSVTIGFAYKIVVALGGKLGVDVGVGHVFVGRSYTLSSTFDDMLLGWAGETAGRRIDRLCQEEGVALNYYGDIDETPLMGPQPVDKLLALLEECADVDQGILHESRSRLGLVYRTLRSLYNQTAVTLDYEARQLTPPLEPTDDDQALWNDITAKRTDGSTYRTTRTTGPLSTQDPPDGVGIYDRGALDVNVQYDSQLRDVAGWALHLGTWDEARYPRISAELASPAFVANAALARSVAQLDTGNTLAISNPPAWLPPDDIVSMVQGYTETLTPFLWSFAWNTSPGGPYTVAEVDDDTLGKVDTAGCQLAEDVTTNETAWDIATTAGTLWTETGGEYPFDLRIGGERVTATAMAHTAITFIGAGTAAHADNASVTPTLHGSSATGDLLLVFAAIRDTGSATPVAPTGYTELFSRHNMALYGKIHSGSESNPTVTFTGGSAGMDTSAQCATFRSLWTNIENLVIRGHHNPNDVSASGQDIPYPSMPVEENNCLVLFLGWKQDDWTSVATVTSGTEIGEPDTTTGNDQGIVWDYWIQTTATNVPAGSFTVTGGASANSRGATVLIRSDTQTATVTRSVNGVVKTHATGTALSLWTPDVAGK